MKVILLGATLGSGISKKSGAPKAYQIASLDYVVPARDYISGDHNIQKCGFELKSVSMVQDQTLYNKVVQIGETHGICEVDLVLQPDPTNMSRTIVSDITVIK